jgi:hypothetical protein
MPPHKLSAAQRLALRQAKRRIRELFLELADEIIALIHEDAGANKFFVLPRAITGRGHINASNLKDLSGLVSGRLTVLSFAYVNHRRQAVWMCRCQCGRITTSLERT